MYYTVSYGLDRGEVVKQIDKTLLIFGFATNYYQLSSPKIPNLK